ncbi:MAG: YihA family ribosome biogenesis GTP-binding protein [Bacteroidales bacterium]|nr:YihA family ribosome biogenesis GTP-binding protein [Candidatus Hennigimonas equi]
MKISSTKFAGSSSKVGGKPSLRLPEFAFIGRSNVGKSSLINALCGNSRLAMTSSKPGKTRLVNHFLINDGWYLVDLPGYGYAKASRSERAAIENVIRDYLNHSEELKELFVLIDSRHDLVSSDAEFLREMGESDIPFSIIFTKSDKSGPVACARQVEKIKEQIAAIIGATPACFVSSSLKGTGKEEILGHIENLLQ